MRSSTSPTDRPSIAFHLAMGFTLEGGDGVVNSWPARVDYPLPGESRVGFVKRLRLGLSELSLCGNREASHFAESWRLQRTG